MQLARKKELAAKVLKVGKNRIVFVEGHLSEIKEAISRMDILDLHKSGAIQIKEVKGRKKIENGRIDEELERLRKKLILERLNM